jgi:cytochrome c peroxidase
MHDGAFKTLEEAVEFIDQGGGSNPNLSPLMKPLNMTAKETADLVAFLKALTGEAIKFTVPQLPK